MEITQAQNNSILDIIDKMADEHLLCRKRFACYKSSFENLCKVKGIGAFDEIECDSEDARCCGLSFEAVSHRFCRCPLRRYIAQNFHR
jgi:hypothetical protein